VFSLKARAIQFLGSPRRGCGQETTHGRSWDREKLY